LAIKKHIYEAFKKGEKRIEEVGIFPSTWYYFFEFKADPFKIQPIDPLERKEDIDLFINRTAELEEIAEYIGMATKATHSFNLAIIGAEGIGKRSILRVVNAYAQEKGYHGMIYNVSKDEVVYPEDYEKVPVMGPPEEKFLYVVFEDTKPIERAKQYIQRFIDKPNIVISFWTPEQIIDGLDFDREMYIYPLKAEEIKDMILIRTKNAGGKEEIISKDALDIIAENSLGIPRLALKLTRYSFELAFRKRKKIVNMESVKEASSRYGYETKKEIELTTKEKEIVKFLLKTRKISPPDLAEEASLDRVIAWKYLERLHNKGLLEKEYHGKTTYFTLKEALAAKMQLELYPRR
jgi:predicted transcriptional regulator